jgi:riboflavin biosynthesis pyrimidine reductase
VFAAMRDLADVVLAGAGTVVAEGYRAVTVSPARAELRRRFGLRPVLPTAVVSRSLPFDPAGPLFTGATPEARTIVLTCAAAPAERRAALARVADVVLCGEQTVDLVAARTALEERGLTRILSEGGPTAFAELVAAGVADELCLSLTPLLTGPGPKRIVDGPAQWTPPKALAMIGALEEDGALFLRYRIPGTMSSRS